MLIRQVELVDAKLKPLKSLDKSLRLVFYININNNNDIDLNYIKNLLFKPLILNIDIDKH